MSLNKDLDFKDCVFTEEGEGRDARHEDEVPTLYRLRQGHIRLRRLISADDFHGSLRVRVWIHTVPSFTKQTIGNSQQFPTIGCRSGVSC